MLFSPAFYFSQGGEVEAVFFCTDLPPPHSTYSNKNVCEKKITSVYGDGGGGGRWGIEIICVCCKSHFPPFKQRGEYVCNVCIFSVLQKKKKKLKDNGKVHSH